MILCPSIPPHCWDSLSILQSILTFLSDRWLSSGHPWTKHSQKAHQWQLHNLRSPQERCHCGAPLLSRILFIILGHGRWQGGAELARSCTEFRGQRSLTHTSSGTKTSLEEEHQLPKIAACYLTQEVAFTFYSPGFPKGILFLVCLWKKARSSSSTI